MYMGSWAGGPLTINRPAGVASEINLGKHSIFSMSLPSENETAHFGFETQRRRHQRSKTRTSVTPMKRIMSAQKINNITDHEICRIQSRRQLVNHHASQWCYHHLSTILYQRPDDKISILKSSNFVKITYHMFFFYLIKLIALEKIMFNCLTHRTRIALPKGRIQLSSDVTH